MRPTFEYGACRIGQHLDRQIIDPFPDLFGEVVIRRIAPVLAISRDLPVQANFVSRRSPLHMQEHLAVYPGEGHREFRGELRAGFGRRLFPLCQRGEVFGGFARSGGSLFRRRIDDESGAGKLLAYLDRLRRSVILGAGHPCGREKEQGQKTLHKAINVLYGSGGCGRVGPAVRLSLFS